MEFNIVVLIYSCPDLHTKHRGAENRIFSIFFLSQSEFYFEYITISYADSGVNVFLS